MQFRLLRLRFPLKLAYAQPAFGLRVRKTGWKNEDSEEDSDFELESAGLFREDLEFMDEDERREVLEEAGLDPDEFEF